MDCEQLMPRGEGGLAGRAQELGAEVARVERDIGEAEAKHELYKLLEVRTGCAGGTFVQACVCVCVCVCMKRREAEKAGGGASCLP